MRSQPGSEKVGDHTRDQQPPHWREVEQASTPSRHHYRRHYHYHHHRHRFIIVVIVVVIIYIMIIIMITRLLGDYNKVYCHIIHCQLSSSFIKNGSITNAELAEPLVSPGKEAQRQTSFSTSKKIMHRQFPSAIEPLVVFLILHRYLRFCVSPPSLVRPSFSVF